MEPYCHQCAGTRNRLKFAHFDLYASRKELPISILKHQFIHLNTVDLKQLWPYHPKQNSQSTSGANSVRR